MYFLWMCVILCEFLYGLLQLLNVMTLGDLYWETLLLQSMARFAQISVMGVGLAAIQLGVHSTNLEGLLV